VADPNGGVYTVSRSAAGTWGGWAPVSEGSTTPGGHVTALASGDGRIDLFLADPNGGIYTASRSAAGAWGPWRPVSDGSTRPGAPISAVATGPGRIALFVADGNGGIYAAARSAAGVWGPWAPVSEGSTTPGGHVTALASGDGRIALFVADPNGGVYTALGHPDAGFGPWSSVSEGRTSPGGYVAAVAVEEMERVTTFPFFVVRNRIALALADTNGGIYSSKDGAVFRPGINRRLTRLLVGGDHRLLHFASDGATLTLDYLMADTLAPFPEQVQPTLDQGALANIDHIVVLMMENRSFDHMLGYLGKHGGRSDIDGLQEATPDDPAKKNIHGGEVHLPFALTDTRFEVSPCHGFACVDVQVNTQDGVERSDGAMGGFVADFAERAEKARSECVSIEARDIMGYYQAAQVPVFDALAREFLVCDRWFCSHPGGTFPNRFYATTGRLDRDAHGRPELNNPHGIDPVVTKAVFDHLSDAGVSWRYFEHGYGFLRLFDRYRFDDTNVVGIDDPDHGFFAAARAGTLPSVSYIDPDFIEVPPGNDDHAPSDVRAGQRLIGNVVNALVNGPLWSRSLLVVTYDEHGGFYDHVVPPRAVAVSGVDRYGVRVPALVVSPWVDRGAATKIVFDHTSIIKTICRRFLNTKPPDMGERVAQANDLSQVLKTSARQDRPEIALPPGPAANGRFDWTPWSSVSEGSSTAGAPMSAVATGAGRVALFVADRTGGVYSAARDAEGAWGAWQSVSEGSTTPGGHVTAVASGDGRIELFLADPNGGVYTAARNAAGVWGGWSSVAEGSTRPGAPVSAVVTGPGRIALFVADPNGGVYTVSRSAAGTWGGWAPVSEGSTTPGGHVTALASGDGRIDLFLADPNGGIYTASRSAAGAWGPWRPVSDGSTRPGAPISAVATGPGRIALFVADGNGGIYAAARSAAGVWGPWAPVSEGSTTPGGHVTALASGDGRIALFVADPNGGVYTALGHPDAGFGPWSSVSEGRTSPGGYVAAVTVPETEPRTVLRFVSRHDRMALALVDPQGEVRASRTCAPLDPEGEGDFHDVLRAARYMFFE
jgi:phospholipase C/poly(3-hydroxyalkanoate) synthetase